MSMTETTGSVPAAVRPIDRFKQELTMREEMVRALLPKSVTWDKFKATVVSAVGANPKLLECDRASLIKSCIQAAELGLSLNPTLGECDILEVYDKRAGGKVAQCRPRYMGLMKLARRSGEVKTIMAEIVRESDEFILEKGDDPKLVHRVKLGKRGDMIGAYCVWTLKNGEKQFEVMDREQILAIRDRSSAKTREGDLVGPWKTDEEEMWRKTVVRRASKYMPRSCEEFDRAVAVDNLHEAGHDVDIMDGEVIDVTATYEPEPEPVKDHGDRQMADITERVTQKRRTEPTVEPATVVRKAVPLSMNITEDGEEDWDDWAERAREVLLGMGGEDSKRWLEVNADRMGDLEMINRTLARSVLNAAKEAA